jgi:hypothetical protein
MEGAIPYMPLQNTVNPVYAIDSSMTRGDPLVTLTVTYPRLCKFAMAPKKLFQYGTDMKLKVQPFTC